MTTAKRAPRILITDTDRRAYAARLAVELSRAGCEVSALSTAHHPIRETTAVLRQFTYNAIRPLASIEASIRAVEPDLMIPCCDRSVQHLHELFLEAMRNGELAVQALVERSLGSPKSFSTVSSRHDLLRLAQEEGMRVPETSIVNTTEDLQDWNSQHAFPWVLKSDRSWGGRGVRIVQTLEDAEQFLLTTKRPTGLGRAVKRLCVNRDPFLFEHWWDGFIPSVVAQSYIPGRPANCAVLCWKGKVLAGSGVEVVSWEGLTGPASIVRVVDNHEMMHCAERIAARLQLSGFFGLDFMLDASGAAHLIEMNPRTTPLCHLRLGRGRDMVGQLFASVAGCPYVDIPPVTANDLISYFPQAWNSNRESLNDTYQDVPLGEPGLMIALLRSWPEQSFLFRVVNYLHNMMTPSTVVTERKSTG